MIVTPGPDTALTIRNTLLGRARRRDRNRARRRRRAGGLGAGDERRRRRAPRRLASRRSRRCGSPAPPISIFLGVQALRRGASGAAARPSSRRSPSPARPARADCRPPGTASATSATRRWRRSSPACCRSSRRPASRRSCRSCSSGSLFCALTLRLAERLRGRRCPRRRLAAPVGRPPRARGGHRHRPRRARAAPGDRALEVAHRVDGRAVDAHLEVQVRPGGVAGAADGADHRALRDGAAADVDRRLVRRTRSRGRCRGR